MRQLLAVLATAVASQASAAWTPPENPDPRAILLEARADRMAGRFEDALAKQVWFHEKALACDPAMSGVRASFALSDWRSLADKYPPAMAALVAARDRAVADAVDSRDMPASFLDAAAMNKELDQPAQTLLMFRGIEARDPALARKVAFSVQDALVDSGDYATAGRYLDPERELQLAIEIRTGMLRPLREKSSMLDVEALVNRFYDHRVSKAVALLVHANRNADAQELGRKAVAAVPASQAAVQRGLSGEMPEDIVPRAQRDFLRKLMP